MVSSFCLNCCNYYYCFLVLGLNIFSIFWPVGFLAQSFHRQYHPWMKYQDIDCYFLHLIFCYPIAYLFLFIQLIFIIILEFFFHVSFFEISQSTKCTKPSMKFFSIFNVLFAFLTLVNFFIGHFSLAIYCFNLMYK